jgi:hypothetical protein
MLKEKITEIMKKHLICSVDEAQEAIDFVRDLIDAEIEFTEINEPYATNSIARMKVASEDISNLIDGLYE